MNSNKKDKRIELRVTEEEYKKIKEEAEENNTTMSALLLRRFENNVTVYLDTSDYRDLVIQVRRIGTNINTLLKHIHFFGFAEKSDIKRIKNKLNDIERKLKEEEKWANLDRPILLAPRLQPVPVDLAFWDKENF